MRNREEKKKCKGQESTIGKIIYGFLLFLPLLAIGVTCGYAMFNKNAYKSYVTGDTEYKYSLITEKTQFVTDHTYYVNAEEIANAYNISSNYLQTPVFKYNSISLDVNTILNTTIQINGFCLFINSTEIQFRSYNNTTYTNLQFKIYDKTNSTWTSETYKSFSFVLNSIVTDNENRVINNAFSEIIEIQAPMNNVFYSAVNKVQQSPLFNWAENSIIYTTTSTTCNALSITTPFLPLLMSYWLIISVIYFLYDIALMLVWIVHRKIHELQESI